MVRHYWTPRMLARHISPSGLFGRPTLAFRFRADKGPHLPPNEGYCYRPHGLVKVGWPDDWCDLFLKLDAVVSRTAEGKTVVSTWADGNTVVASWKYVDIYPCGKYVEVYLRGYQGRAHRPLLPVVATTILELQARGVRVEVR